MWYSLEKVKNINLSIFYSLPETLATNLAPKNYFLFIARDTGNESSM